MPETSLQKYEQEADQVNQALAAVQILDAVSYEAAADYLRDVKTTLKSIEQQRTEITKPMNAALKKTNELFASVSRKYLKAEAGLKLKIATYLESEKERETKLLAEYAENPSDALVLMAQAAPVAQGVSTRTVLDYEVSNEAEVPREFLCLDEKKIGAYVRAGGTIPGIRTVSKTIVAARSRSDG